MNRLIVKAYFNSIFTNDLKRKEFFFLKNVHNCRLSHFKHFISVFRLFCKINLGGWDKVGLCIYQSPLILTELFQHDLINVSYLTACYLYQVMMTLHFLNDISNDAESTQKSKNTS